MTSILPLSLNHVDHYRTEEFYKSLVPVGSLRPEETLCEEVTIVHTMYDLLIHASDNSSVSRIVCPQVNYSINPYLQGVHIRTRTRTKRLIVSVLRTTYKPAQARMNTLNNGPMYTNYRLVRKILKRKELVRSVLRTPKKICQNLLPSTSSYEYCPE